MRRTCCRSPVAKGTEISCDWPGSSSEEKRTTTCCSVSLSRPITASTVVTTCQPSVSLTQQVTAEVLAFNLVSTAWPWRGVLSG